MTAPEVTEAHRRAAADVCFGDTGRTRKGGTVLDWIRTGVVPECDVQIARAQDVANAFAERDAQAEDRGVARGRAEELEMAAKELDGTLDGWPSKQIRALLPVQHEVQPVDEEK